MSTAIVHKPRILQINASIFGDNGQSSQLSHYLVQQIQAQQPAELTYRDLAAEPLPHLSAEAVQALITPAAERTMDQQAIVTIADLLINELKEADILVLSAPMYNFAVPSVVKAWMDYVARPGETFMFAEHGPVGLLDSQKVVYVVSTRGGLHQGKVSDSLTPFVNTFLNFLGLSDIRWIYAEGINMADYKDNALANAKATIDRYLVGSNPVDK
ncbi:MAG: NAD(P)H-dependent oxidoreductase [Marinagarivorans sp.]|nr:NAD(P)H-dependent oxidoreductase [Marinagarivorans sp.]